MRLAMPRNCPQNNWPRHVLLASALTARPRRWARDVIVALVVAVACPTVRPSRFLRERTECRDGSAGGEALRVVHLMQAAVCGPRAERAQSSSRLADRARKSLWEAPCGSR